MKIFVCNLAVAFQRALVVLVLATMDRRGNSFPRVFERVTPVRR